MTEKLEKLKKALAAASAGEWDFVVADNAETPHSIVVDADGEELLAHRYGVSGKAQNDVQFIVLAHNLMPDLLEAVELLKMAAHALETPGDFTPEEMQTQVIGDIGAFLARLEGEDMPSFNSVPLNTEMVFGDAPGEMGGLWTRMGQAENALAEKLSALPEGTAVVLGDEAWFLVAKDGQRVLCHAQYENGNVTEVSDRFEFDLMWVDVGAGDLKSYAERVKLATDTFNIVSVTL